MSDGWIPVVPDILYQLPDAGYHASVYFLRGGTQSCLIDPSADLNELAPARPADTLLLTHAHADHIWSVDRLRDADNSRLFVHEGDAAALTDPALNGSPLFGQRFSPRAADGVFRDGDRLPVGDGLALDVFHSPGHTRGSCCFLLIDPAAGKPLALLTGDTLFPGSIGRTDLAGGSRADMLTTLERLRTFMQTLPPELPLLAGHGPASSVGRELSYNPFLFER